MVNITCLELVSQVVALSAETCDSHSVERQQTRNGEDSYDGIVHTINRYMLTAPL